MPRGRKKARGESWEGKRAGGWGQASLLSPTRAIGFSLPNVFRALYLFDNSFFIFGIPWAASVEERKSGRTIFFKIRKQTNKCSKAGRDITWILILSQHGTYFHATVLRESAKRQSQTPLLGIAESDQCCIISAKLTTQEQWWWWRWQWWWWWHFFRRRSSFFFLLSIDALQKFNRNENHY